MRCRKCGAPVIKGGALCEQCVDQEEENKTGPGIVSSDDHRRITLPVKSADVLSGFEKETKKNLKSNPPANEASSKKQRPRSSRPSVPSPIVLEGKYRLMNELGRGAMGTVFLAEETALQAQV